MKAESLTFEKNFKINNLLKIKIIYNYWNARDPPLRLGITGRKWGILLELLRQYKIIEVYFICL